MGPWNQRRVSTSLEAEGRCWFPHQHFQAFFPFHHLENHSLFLSLPPNEGVGDHDKNERKGFHHKLEVMVLALIDEIGAGYWL